MTDTEILRRWTIDREIQGNGRALAEALDRRLKELEEELSIVREQFEVAADRAQSWKNLCEHWKELAEARGEALAIRDQRGKCGYKNHHMDCNCNGEGGDR